MSEIPRDLNWDLGTQKTVTEAEVGWAPSYTSHLQVQKGPDGGLHGHPHVISNDPSTPNLGYQCLQNLQEFPDAYNRQDPPWLGS